MTKSNSRVLPKVFLALDVQDKDKAFELAEMWSPHIAGLKVGPRLGFQLSTQDWSILSKQCDLFIDYKFFDIPSTVLSSVQRSFESGASFCTVHAMNGAQCLKALSKLETELNHERPFKILCVTLLTSFDQETNSLPLVSETDTGKIVSKLADVVLRSGLKGIVSSPHEITALKTKDKNAFLVTPGIRFTDDSLDDQKRVMSPAEAWSKGSDYLVMGRSLIRASESTSQFDKTLKLLESQWASVQL
jgi:orotidine-5'-phosphate decarboxylase